MIGDDIVESITADRSHASAVNQHIGYLKAGIGRDGKSFAFAIIHRYGSRRCDAAVGTCRCRDGVGFDGKARTDGVIGRHICKSIARNCSHTRSVH